MPRFSIITVTLNAGDALGQTVASVRAQSRCDFEHLIKDGGSNDGSVEKFVRASDGYSPLLLCRSDRGIYDAMNQALSNAVGDYVLFMNAGDRLYDSSSLARVASCLDSNWDIDLLYGDYFYDPLGMTVHSPRQLGPFTLFRNTLCHQACIIKLDAIRRAGLFDTSLRVMADYDMLLRIVGGCSGSVKYLPVPLCRALGGGFSAKHAALAGTEAVAVRRRHYTRWQRLAFGAMLSVTMPSLRNKLMLSNNLLFLRRLYAGLANRANG